MTNRSVRARRRWAAALGIVVLSLIATVGTTGVSAADEPSGRTPDSALPISAVPFTDAGQQTWLDGAPVATDPAAQRVATACTSGASLYGTTWWTYTASSASTFVSHASTWVGTVGGDEPIGLAVLSGDLSTVLSCGKEGTSISDAGATTLQAGQSVYVVTYLRAPVEPTILGPSLGLYPSTGVVPGNDAFTAPTVIGSLPFSATVDTTLATREPSEFACYSKFGVGPSVWYAVTAPTTRRLIVNVSGDFDVQFVIVPPQVADSFNTLCGSEFQADAGVTYRIGIYGTDELRNSGRASITVSAVPAAPSVKIAVTSPGTVKKRTGVVRLSGTVTCSGTDTTQPVTGTITQVFKRTIHQQAFTGSTAACTGKRAAWTATIKPTTFLWTTGDATITAAVTACTTGGCTSATTKATVRLKAA